MKFKKLGLFLATQALVSVAWGAGATLHLQLKGLSAMKGQHFEGWNIVDGKALSTGRFSLSKKGTVYAVDSDGKALKALGSDGEAYFKLGKEHKNSSLFVLTIEPNGDKDAGPSDVHIVGGNYNRSATANLSIDHGSSLGTNFENAQGSYILAAPTGGEFNQGVWFVDPAKGEGSLDLPTLPKGWAYEGWIVNAKNGKKFSTGLFQDTNKSDSDVAGILAGPLALNAPNVPGQDIVKSPVVLNDGIHKIVVSVEPYPDFDPRPFDLKVLAADVDAQSEGMTSLNLGNISAGHSPSGIATIK